jgi:perosamine synthetase
MGTNNRMSDLTAAIGCAQLAKIDELVAGRRAAADRMNKQLASVEGIETPTVHPEGTHVYQLYTVEFDQDIDREAVVEDLSAKGIDSKVYWDTPVHATQYYEETMSETPDLPMTDRMADSILSLPMYPGLSNEQTHRITEAVAESVEGRR